MIHRKLRQSRSGFTLLEVLLASAITLILLFALYVIMRMQLQEADLDRVVVERATVVRGIMNRLTIDLSICVSPVAPFSQAQVAASSGTTATTGTTGSTGTGSGASGAASGSGSGASGSGSGSGSGGLSNTTSTSPPNDNPIGTLSYFVGVIGNTSSSGGSTPSGGPASSPDQLTLWVARVPDYVNVSDDQSGNAPPLPSDIRRIDYWLDPDNGLVRYESMWVTSDNVSTLYGPPTPDPTAYPDPKLYYIAPEVTSLMFEYWDPTNLVWQSQWDGSVVGPDGLTPTGPPGAIRVTMTLKAGAGESEDKQYVQVIPIQTAPGSTLTSTSTTTTTTTTTTP